MLYVFLFSFLIFLIIDYIYLYIFFDSKIFLNKSGSKLSYLIYEENRKVDIKYLLKHIFSKQKFINLFKGFIFILIMLALNMLIFSNIVFSEFLILDLGYKKIEIVSTFQNYWIGFIKIYYLLYIIFLIIIYFFYISKFLESFSYYKRKKEQDFRPNNDEDRIYIGYNLNNNVYINKAELYKNVLITGSIGTGKTSGAINTFCKYMIKSNISGLVIDIKGNYVEKIESFLHLNQNIEVIVIGDNSNYKYNPVRTDISSIEMANRLRKVIELISVSNSSDSYWLDKVENTLFNILVLIKYCNNNCDLKEIHRLVTDDEYLNVSLDKVKNLVVTNTKDEKTAHDINNLLMFFTNEYFKLDNRVSTIIKSEITRLTIPFVTEYETCNKFGRDSNDGIKINFNLNKSKIVIFSMNMSKNFLLTKILATFIKLDFQSEVLQNINNPIETFCICDEYQEFANRQDAHFLSLSREAKCMNIFSMQSYSSLINTIKNEYSCKVIIQNMVNKIWFRNDDNYTVEEVVKQIGKEKKKFKTSSISEGAQESKKSIINGLKNKKSNISKTISYAENIDNIISSKVITQELETLEALVLFGCNGKMEKVQRIKFKREGEI